MKPGEIASEQIYFENTRRAKDGHVLSEKNSPEYLIERLRGEICELEQSLSEGSPVETILLELADVFIFAGAIGAKVCLEHGERLSLINRVIEFKLAINQEKYSEENFITSETVDDAIAVSREKWAVKMAGDDL